MNHVLAICLGAGLFGMLFFGVLPFIVETKFVWLVAHIKNPFCQIFGLYGLRRAKRNRTVLTLLSRRLQLVVLLSLTFSLLTGCAEPKVGPKPDIAPVAASNTATRASINQTRASIKQSRAHIKEAQIHEAKGDTALEKAEDLLNQMLKK